MMNLDDFEAAAVEKTSFLIEFLDELGRSAFVRNHAALHGGTALNLFAIPPRRLSLDADVSYIGSEPAKEARNGYNRLKREIIAAGEELGCKPFIASDEHSGTTIKLVYFSNSLGKQDFIKVDLVFPNRRPLMETRVASCTLEGFDSSFPINHPIEIAAGKLKACLDRAAARDLFDAVGISESFDAFSTGDSDLDHKILLFYRAMSRSFPRPYGIESKWAGKDALVSRLWEVLPIDDRPGLSELVNVAAAAISSFLKPRDDDEVRFLELLCAGDFRPELLFGDYPEQLFSAENSPAMIRRVENIQKALACGRTLEIDREEKRLPLERPFSSPPFELAWKSSEAYGRERPGKKDVVERGGLRS